MKTIPLNKMRRDSVFKALHQQLAPPNYYALDGDLILVEKIPPATVYVVAHLEFKMNTETITFTQAVYFNQLVSAPMPWRVPVYIIRARHPYDMPPKDATHLSRDYCQHALNTHRFDIAEYLYADWKPEPPRVTTASIAENIGWQELIKWEQELRQAKREQLAPYINTDWQAQHVTPAPIVPIPNKQVKTKTPAKNNTPVLPL
jgi:hypothetical protein